VLFAVLALCAAWAARADAATYCVGVQAPGCTVAGSAAEAFDVARSDSDTDTILLGRLTASGAFADAPGRAVHVVGLGATATVLRAGGAAPALRLQDSGTTVTGVRVEGGDALQIDAGATVRSAVVAGRVRVRGGNAELGSVAISSPAPAVQVTCAAASTDLALGHVTVTGTGAAGVTADCGVAGRSVTLTAANSVVWGFTLGFAAGAGTRFSAGYSDFPGAVGETNRTVDPGFVAPGDPRLRADSPLVDTGRPGSLDAGEPHEDALGYVRAVDGNADGVPRRDVGALEYQPPPPRMPDGNFLVNPAAEAGHPADDDSSSPAPPAWTRTGNFTFVAYGTVAGMFPFPSRRVAEALDAGDAFFAAGPKGGGSATQTVDLTSASPEIDLGLGTVTLSALLGGYRASGDGPIVEAVFRAPGGRALRRVHIGPVSVDDRAAATNLVPRSAHAAIPPLTRTIAVTMRSTPPSGSYDDAYFDDVALVPLTSGAPPHLPPAPRAKLKPYAGVALTAGRIPVDSRRRAWVRVACGSRTVDRCRGVVTLTSRLGGPGVKRLGRRRIEVRRGHVGRVLIGVSRATRRALHERRQFSGRLYAATRDGQGLTKTSVSPVRVVRGSGFRR
jgi:hypothetical protein